MSGGSEHQHSMAFASVAFEKMKDLHHAPTPHNYEIWYNYASAAKPSLNQAVNDLITASGTVSQSELDELYEKFLSPMRLTDQMDMFGSQVIGEIDQMMTVIDGTLDSTTRHTESLADVTAEIDDSTDQNALRSVINKLVQTAKDIERTNHNFEAHLKESKHEINELQKHLDAVRAEILTDPLTTLSNRKHFDQTIVKAIADVAANNTPLSLVLIDIDDFKKFNDTWGHLTGDQVLRLVALSLKHNVKGQDLAARYGGEEFAVVLPNTALRQATTVADHIRRAVMNRELMKRSTGENLGHVTISLGVAALRAGDTPQTLIERADNCLYAAKRNGRNRVVCESDPEMCIPAEAKVA
jgi:diguanylate cyclase